MISFRSNKTRFYTLLITAALFFVVSWKLALKKTVDVHRQITEVENKLDQVESAPEQIAVVEKRLNYLNQMLVKESSGNAFQDRVLDEISSICRQKGLLLKQMPPMFRNVDNNYLVEIINVDVSGPFHRLLQLLYEIEQPQKNMNLISARFYVEENKRIKQKQLILSLYIQSLQDKPTVSKP